MEDKPQERADNEKYAQHAGPEEKLRKQTAHYAYEQVLVVHGHLRDLVAASVPPPRYLDTQAGA
jgi:hypothetical protein